MLEKWGQSSIAVRKFSCGIFFKDAHASIDTAAEHESRFLNTLGNGQRPRESEKALIG